MITIKSTFEYLMMMMILLKIVNTMIIIHDLQVNCQLTNRFDLKLVLIIFILKLIKVEPMVVN